MRHKHHFAIGRIGVVQSPPEQVLLLPNQPIEPEPIRHSEPIKREHFEKDKKKKSKYQREWKDEKNELFLIFFSSFVI